MTAVIPAFLQFIVCVPVQASALITFQPNTKSTAYYELPRCQVKLEVFVLRICYIY